MKLVDFGSKLRDFLGDTHEGRELSVMDVADFYELFKESKLSFDDWIRSI